MKYELKFYIIYIIFLKNMEGRESFRDPDIGGQFILK
jgi:hypothetical protein